MKELFLSALAALATTAGVAQTSFSWSDPVDCNMSGTGALRPRIAFNGTGNPVVLWGMHGPNSNYVSVGNGSSFSAPVEVSTTGCEPSVADWMGSSIAAAGNTVWVVMKALPEETAPIYVRRSDDGGFTWGDTIRVDPFDGLVSRFPSIDVLEPDAPMVQYMQFDEGFSGARQVVTRMMDGTFMDPVQVSAPYAPGLVCDCCPGQIVSDPDHAVALYRNAGSNIRVMWGPSPRMVADPSPQEAFWTPRDGYWANAQAVAPTDISPVIPSDTCGCQVPTRGPRSISAVLWRMIWPWATNVSCTPANRSVTSRTIRA